MAASRAIGIDLGTTYSCAAFVENSKPRIIQSKLGYATVPSVVTYDDRGEAVVGELAERRMILQPFNTIYGSKRLLGRTYLKSAVERFQPQFRYKLVADENGFIAAKIFDHVFPLVDVSALILKEIRRSAQRILGEKIERAVITVPAYFTENQRALVREAGQMADLEVIRIINEPTAAALAYGSGSEKQRLLIFDLGGGTFDVSVVEACNYVYTVLGVGGDTFLGGIDVDCRLSDLVADRLAARLNREMDLDAVNLVRLRVAAQKAKHQLSVQQTTFLQIPNLALPDGTTIDVNEKITRKELEEATSDLCDLTMSVVQDVIKSANLKTSDIDEVLLVGGQTRMPILRERLKRLFGFEPSTRVHPDEVVALGAAIAAESGSGVNAPVLLDVLPVPLGIAGPDGTFHEVVARNTPVPHETSATLMIQPGSDLLRLALFQGTDEKAVNNEYLGTVTVGGLGAATKPVECALKFKLNAECILKLHVSIKALGISKEVKLATHFTAKEVVAEMSEEQVEIRVPQELRIKQAVKDKIHVAGATSVADKVDNTPPVLRDPAPTKGFRMQSEDRGWFRRMLDRLSGR